MIRENFLTALAARAARIPFALAASSAFVPPQKALILHPCCLSQVMLATPLLAALQTTYPQTRFDWAVSDWARAAIISNPRITELIRTAPGDIHDLSWRELGAFIQQLRDQNYDTCFIPSRSTLLAYVAWRSKIPQRIGLNVNGRGFAHSIAVKKPTNATHTTALYLALASAANVPEDTIQNVSMEFIPPDRDRTAVTRRLIEEVDWLGDVPLVLMHPGGGVNPIQSNELKRWPIERFTLLANHCIEKHLAKVVLVGTETERPLTKAIDGMLAGKITNLAGRLNLGELGAMCEVADLYIGNDAGPTHIAAATGCPTLAIYGPSDPVLSRPYTQKGKLITLWHDASGVEEERPFSWDIGVGIDKAIAAVDKLLEENIENESSLPYLTSLKQ